jgi:hypothetical protein
LELVNSRKKNKRRAPGGAILGRIIAFTPVLAGFAFEQVEALLEILRLEHPQVMVDADMKNPGAVSRIASGFTRLAHA